MTKIDDHLVENIAGTWLYHLAVDGKALCGASVMPTQVSLDVWGVKTHLNETYCSKCTGLKEMSETHRSLGLYRLDEHRSPVPCSVETWSELYDKASRQTALTMIGHIRVSTVFLALDHNHSGEGDPVLWETMVFGGELNQEQWRYSTEEEARRNHERIVQEIREHQRGGRIFRFLLRIGNWLPVWLGGRGRS